MYVATILDETFLFTIFDFTKDMTTLRQLNVIKIYCLWACMTQILGKVSSLCFQFAIKLWFRL